MWYEGGEPKLDECGAYEGCDCADCRAWRVHVGYGRAHGDALVGTDLEAGTAGCPCGGCDL